MDLPVHIAGGAFAGNMILHCSRYSGRHLPSDSFKMGMACFLAGVYSHLLLDALPYYDWIFHIPIFSELPGKWLWRQVAATVPVIIMILVFSRRHWFLSLVSMNGGLYPDLEKLLYFDFHLPKAFVVFPYHSCRLSDSAWEKAHEFHLIVFEIALFALLMTGIFLTSHYTNSPLVLYNAECKPEECKN